jgi:hypothetical protein
MPEREFPAILGGHPGMQFRIQFRVPAEQLLPVGHLASGNRYGVGVEYIFDG